MIPNNLFQKRRLGLLAIACEGKRLISFTFFFGVQNVSENVVNHAGNK
jgi:hypothetical protein